MLRVLKGKTTPEDVARNMTKHIVSPPENSRIVVFNPQLAKWVLDTYNHNNRPKKPGKIKEYAEDMVNEKWGLTGETIKFSDQGRLVDGQNRLMACVRSGAEFRTHVVFGIEDELFHIMDTGKVRSGPDSLSIAGYTNCNVLAAALRWARILATSPSTRPTFKNDELLDMVKGRYGSVQNSIGVGVRMNRVYSHPSGQMSALHWLFAKYDRDKADEFFDAWATGKRTGRFKVLGHLQDSLVRVKDAAHGRLNDTVRAAMVVKAWNIFQAGRKGSKNACLMSIGEEFPKLEN